jgi:hypothetical protein
MAVNRSEIYPGSVIWAKHKNKDRPHLVLKVTDGGDDIFLIQVAVMSSKKALYINSALKLAEDSYVHLNRIVELELSHVKSIDKMSISEDTYKEAVTILKQYIDTSYDFAM